MKKFPDREYFSLPSFSLCALILFMFDAATEPVAAVQPDPPRAEPNRPVPPKIARVLSVLHPLIAYGKNLTDILQRHAAAPYLLPFLEFLGISFGTRNLALILARIARGLLRAAALEARLRRRAARGPDLQSAPRRRRSKRKPRPAKPAIQPNQPALDPYRLPTPEEIEAEVRRRPIGAVLTDICLDLGIAPAQMDNELHLVIIGHGGSLARYLLRQDKQRSADPTGSVGRKTPDLIRGHSAEDGPSPGDSPIPIAVPTLEFPPWPGRSPHPRTPMPSGLSRGCTGPPPHKTSPLTTDR
jgi:hypothetical protein